MKRGQHVLLVIVVVSVIAISSLFIIEDALAWLGGLVQQFLTVLISMGKSIAGATGGSGSSFLVFYVFGNILLTCIVLLSTGFHSFTRRKSRPVHLAIASATIIAGLSLMVVQAGFCQGFPPTAIPEWLKDISKALMGVEGLTVSFVPFYYVIKARPRRSLKVRGEDIG